MEAAGAGGGAAGVGGAVAIACAVIALADLGALAGAAALTVAEAAVESALGGAESADLAETARPDRAFGGILLELAAPAPAVAAEAGEFAGPFCAEEVEVPFDLTVDRQAIGGTAVLAAAKTPAAAEF
jgi:hypothetical protein